MDVLFNTKEDILSQHISNHIVVHFKSYNFVNYISKKLKKKKNRVMPKRQKSYLLGTPFTL